MTFLHDHIAEVLELYADPTGTVRMDWLAEADALLADPTMRAIIDLAASCSYQEFDPPPAFDLDIFENPDVRALLADWRGHAE